MADQTPNNMRGFCALPYIAFNTFLFFLPTKNVSCYQDRRDTKTENNASN